MINIVALQSQPKWNQWGKLAADAKKNWLNTIGMVFLAQASLEYFSHHFFGCMLAATALLGYASLRASIWHKHAQDQEIRRIAAETFNLAPSNVPRWAMKRVPPQPHMSEEEFNRFLPFVIVSVFFILFLVLTLYTVPPDVQDHFTRFGAAIKQLF